MRRINYIDLRHVAVAMAAVFLSFYSHAQCPTAPSGLSSTALSTTSASVSFTGGSGTSWEVQYGPDGFTLGSGITVNSATTTATINTLSTNVNYDVYVRGNCGGGSFSSWTGPIAMATDIVPCDNMEVYQTGGVEFQSNLIVGWAGNDYDAEFSTDQASSGSKSLKIHTSGPNAASDVIALLNPSLTSGIHNVQTDIFIPSTYGGYYNILHNYTGATNVWAIEVYISSAGLATVNEGSNGTGVIGTYNINMGAWNTIEHIIDLDNDTAFILVNGDFTDVGWQFSLGSANFGDQFNAFNFYSAAPVGDTPLEYFDDFCMTDAHIDDVGIAEMLISVPPICGDSNFMVPVVVENFGYNNQSNFPISFATTGSVILNVNTTYPGTLKPGERDTLMFGPVNTLNGGVVSISASTGLSGDTDVNNDEVEANNITFLPGVSVEFGPADTTYCSNQNFSIVLNAMNANATYLWNDNSTASTRTIDTAGVYAVTVTATNGCTATDEIEIEEIAAPSVNLGADLTECEGENVSFFLNAGSANAGSNILWSTNETTQYVQATTFGTYSVTVTNAEGCAESDTVEVMEIPLPAIGFESYEVCGGDTVTLDAGNTGSTYFWSVPNHSDQVYHATQTGNYAVTVIDPNGCENSDTAYVTVNPRPFVILGPDRVIGEGATVTLDAGNPGASYAWSTGATTQSITVGNAGTYTVTVTNNFGCENSDAVKVTVVVGVDELLGSNVQFFPNPVHDVATIRTDMQKAGNMKLDVFASNGQLVKSAQQHISSGANEVQIDLSELSPGIYFINMQLDDQPLARFSMTKQ